MEEKLICITTVKSRKLDTLGNHSRNIGLCSNPPAVNTAFLYDIL